MLNFFQLIPLGAVGFTVVWQIAAESVPGASTNVVCVNNLWTFNEGQQSPCLLTAALGSPCDGGNTTLLALAPGAMYTGPPVSDLCQCSSVMYSVISACAACQQDVLVDTWPHWKTNCAPQNITMSGYPLPIPSSVAVPSWAYLDVNVTWDSIAALSVHNSGAPDSSSVSPTSSKKATSSPSSTSVRTASSTHRSTTSSNKPPPTGAIAGGVVGGIAVIALLGFLGFVIHRRRAKKSLMHREKIDLLGTDSSSPPVSEFASQVPLRLYDPDDPSTYPPKVPLPVPPTA